MKSADSIRLVLPATSANLGPAFDSAALALQLYLRVEAEIVENFSISATGRDSALCGALENNLLVDTYLDVLRHAGVSPIPLSLRLDNDIPIGKGCGSSAASLLAAIMMAVHFGNLNWNGDRILSEAARRERHADNVAACWLGGLVICSHEAGALDDQTSREITTAKVEARQSWQLLLAVPEQSLATTKARSVLPATYSRSQVVANIQNSMLLASAFAQGRSDLLRVAMQDRLHEPYREPLCSLLTALRPLTRERSVVGVALSGAGPSVLLVLEPEARLGEVEEQARVRLAASDLTAELIRTRIADEGAISNLLIRGEVR